MKRKTQREWVLDWLKAGRSITPLDAYLGYGILRLGARIFDLKIEGWRIVSETKAVTNRFGDICHVAEYRLV